MPENNNEVFTLVLKESLKTLNRKWNKFKITAYVAVNNSVISAYVVGTLNFTRKLLRFLM